MRVIDHAKPQRRRGLTSEASPRGFGVPLVRVLLARHDCAHFRLFIHNQVSRHVDHHLVDATIGKDHKAIVRPKHEVSQNHLPETLDRPPQLQGAWL